MSKAAELGCRVIVVVESRVHARAVRLTNMSIATASMIGDLKRRDEAKLEDKIRGKVPLLDSFVDDRTGNGIVYLLPGFLLFGSETQRR